MAQKVAIVTDSSACIPPQLVEHYGLAVVPLNVVFGDKTYRDGIDISPAEFYARLRAEDGIPTTSHSSPGAYLEAYRSASRVASGILCITLSARFSGQFNSARSAEELAKEALPEVTIRVFDCGTAAAAQGLVVLAAARAAAAGKNISEVAAEAKSVAERVCLLAMVDSLKYLLRGGHVPRLAALATSLLKIKPILTINSGDAHPLGRPRTILGAIDRMIGIMKQKVTAGQPLHVAVMHADALDNAVRLKEQIAANFECDELLITEFTPVMGAHIGPGLIGVAFYSGNIS